MAGIYIHIPFCKQACHYCNFHFSTSNDYRERMVQALIKELEMRKDELKEPIETIYLGGGTPSIIESAQTDALIQTVIKHYAINNSPEITLEANPDDITTIKARDWKSMGINRFSIGIQSFSNKYLEWMNRAHNAEQSMDCINTIRSVGFENFSIDLIYGTPGQTISDWEHDLGIAINQKVPHLSCYALTIEEETPLFHLIKKGAKQKTNSDLQSDQFTSLLNLTNSAGYRHYEISNFALPGMESKHNSAYWHGSPYLGIGPSAHSFHHQMRSWNISNNMNYMQAIENNQQPAEQELLTEIDAMNEYIMTKLRLDTGIIAEELKMNWGIGQLSRIEKTISRYVDEQKVERTNSGWRLTDKGKFFADGIAADLFLV